jgi:hypothetical protein
MAQSSQAGNQIVTANNPLIELLATPLSPDWTIDRVAEQLLSTIASKSSGDQEFAFTEEAITDGQPRRIIRPLLACLANMSADEAGTSSDIFGGHLSFKRSSSEGPVWILGEFENKQGNVRVTLHRSTSPPMHSEPMKEERLEKILDEEVREIG